MNKLMTKDELREVLTKSIAVITFEKTDGSIRDLKGTLMPEHLPPLAEDITNINKPKRDENPKILAVWDLENGGWRSFRVESVLNLRTVKG